MRTEWNTFKGGVWQREINVRDFIQKNYTPYDAATSFWKVLPGIQRSSGTRSWSCQRRNRKPAESWIWIPKSFPPSRPTAQDI